MVRSEWTKKPKVIIFRKKNHVFSTIVPIYKNEQIFYCHIVGSSNKKLLYLANEHLIYYELEVKLQWFMSWYIDKYIIYIPVLWSWTFLGQLQLQMGKIKTTGSSSCSKNFYLFKCYLIDVGSPFIHHNRTIQHYFYF